MGGWVGNMISLLDFFLADGGREGPRPAQPVPPTTTAGTHNWARYHSLLRGLMCGTGGRRLPRGGSDGIEGGRRKEERQRCKDRQRESMKSPTTTLFSQEEGSLWVLCWASSPRQDSRCTH